VRERIITHRFSSKDEEALRNLASNGTLRVAIGQISNYQSSQGYERTSISQDVVLNAAVKIPVIDSLQVEKGEVDALTIPEFRTKLGRNGDTIIVELKETVDVNEDVVMVTRAVPGSIGVSSTLLLGNSIPQDTIQSAAITLGLNYLSTDIPQSKIDNLSRIIAETQFAVMKTPVNPGGELPAPQEQAKRNQSPSGGKMSRRERRKLMAMQASKRGGEIDSNDARDTGSTVNPGRDQRSVTEGNVDEQVTSGNARSTASGGHAAPD